jgi:hypothetical protein
MGSEIILLNPELQGVFLSLRRYIAFEFISGLLVVVVKIEILISLLLCFHCTITSTRDGSNSEISERTSKFLRDTRDGQFSGTIRLLRAPEYALTGRVMCRRLPQHFCGFVAGPLT